MLVTIAAHTDPQALLMDSLFHVAETGIHVL
jgi:hypothetical protein